MLRHDVVDEVTGVDLRLIAIGLGAAVAALDKVVSIPIRRNCSPLGHVGMLRGREPARWRDVRSFGSRSFRPTDGLIPSLKNDRPCRTSGAGRCRAEGVPPVLSIANGLRHGPALYGTSRTANRMHCSPDRPRQKSTKKAQVSWGAATDCVAIGRPILVSRRLLARRRRIRVPLGHHSRAPAGRPTRPPMLRRCSESRARRRPPASSS